MVAKRSHAHHDPDIRDARPLKRLRSSSPASAPSPRSPATPPAIAQYRASNVYTICAELDDAFEQHRLRGSLEYCSPVAFCPDPLLADSDLDTDDDGLGSLGQQEFEQLLAAKTRQQKADRRESRERKHAMKASRRPARPTTHSAHDRRRASSVAKITSSATAKSSKATRWQGRLRSASLSLPRMQSLGHMDSSNATLEPTSPQCGLSGSSFEHQDPERDGEERDGGEEGVREKSVLKKNTLRDECAEKERAVGDECAKKGHPGVEGCDITLR